MIKNLFSSGVEGNVRDRGLRRHRSLNKVRETPSDHSHTELDGVAGIKPGPENKIRTAGALIVETPADYNGSASQSTPARRPNLNE